MQAWPEVPQVEAIKDSQVDEEVLVMFWSNYPFPRELSGYLAPSQVPWAPPGCPHWPKAVDRSLMSAGSHSCGAKAVAGSGTEPRPACGTEQTWTKVTAHSCSACTSAFAQVLQTGMVPVLKTYVQTCHSLDFLLLRSVCWNLLHDKFMLNLPMAFNFVPCSLLPSPPTCPICPSYLDSCTPLHKPHIPSVIQRSVKALAFGRALKAAGNKGINGSCEHA